MVDNKTAHLALPLPDLSNMQDEDVPRISRALSMLDAHARDIDASIKAQTAAHEVEIAALKAADMALGAEQDQQFLAAMERIGALEAKSPNTATKIAAGIVKIGTGIEVAEDGTISVMPVEMATPERAGVVLVGEGLSITQATDEGEPPAGVLSLKGHASESGEAYGKSGANIYGHARITDDFEEVASAAEGAALSPAGAKAMWNRMLGLQGITTITASRNYAVPETANYTVTVIGAGAGGGNGGTGAHAWEYRDGIVHTAIGGGGGGGGGAGQVITQTLLLTKGDNIAITIGGAGGPRANGGTTSFGTKITALGGVAGGNGGNASGGPDTYGSTGGGGSAGTSYGSAATGGVSGSGGSGGSGGIGGKSTNGTYGNGGNGGRGGNGSTSGGETASGGAAGAAGTQGAVLISAIIKG